MDSPALYQGRSRGSKSFFFAGCELELAIDAQKAVQRAVFLGVELDPQFAFLHRGPVKPDGLAGRFTVIDVVVGILVQRVAIQKRVRRLATSSAIVVGAGMPLGKAASRTAPEPTI